MAALAATRQLAEAHLPQIGQRRALVKPKAVAVWSQTPIRDSALDRLHNHAAAAVAFEKTAATVAAKAVAVPQSLDSYLLFLPVSEVQHLCHRDTSQSLLQKSVAGAVLLQRGGLRERRYTDLSLSLHHALMHDGTIYMRLRY
jgi:hypothetical protein